MLIAIIYIKNLKHILKIFKAINIFKFEMWTVTVDRGLWP